MMIVNDKIDDHVLLTDDQLDKLGITRRTFYVNVDDIPAHVLIKFMEDIKKEIYSRRIN